MGDQGRHPQRGISEGDYYGLRPWQSGDSMRWVHWRTSAKVGRPMVRQFERRRSRDVALVIDPWLPEEPTRTDEGLLELALSLAATAVADLTSRGHARLTVCLAARRVQCWTGSTSALFCHEVLAQLADVVPLSETPLAEALAQAVDEAPPGAKLVVISPRSPDRLDGAYAAAPPDLGIDPENVSWIDVSSDQLQALFVLE